MKTVAKVLGILILVLVLGIAYYVFSISKNVNDTSKMVKDNTVKQVNNQKTNNYKVDLAALVQAVEQYYADNQTFPSDLSNLVGKYVVTSQSIIDPATNTKYQLVVDTTKMTVQVCTAKENPTKICIPQQ